MPLKETTRGSTVIWIMAGLIGGGYSKNDGERRPLGLPTFEDKISQRAAVMVLEPIWEQIFSSCAFGFRPGRSAHQALQYLRNHIMDEGGRWILDIDIRKYFDTISHQPLREFLDRRVTDGVIRKLIDKLYLMILSDTITREVH